MSLDLNKLANKLANKLDEALIKETTETLTKFLKDKRMSNIEKSSIDVLWNAIPNDAKLNMPFGVYEIVSRMHREETKNAYWAGIDDHLNPNKMPNSEAYCELTFGGEK